MSSLCLRTAQCSVTRERWVARTHESCQTTPERTWLTQRLLGCRYLHAVVVSALPVQVAAVVVHTAVVQGAEAHEAMLQGVITFLVHVVMPNHILFTSESLQRYRDGQ